MRRSSVLMVTIVVVLGLSALGLSALGLSAPVAADDGVLFGYNFPEGYEQNYKVKFNQDVDYGGAGMSQLIDIEATEKCTGVEEDKFLMEMDFNKVDAARMQFDNMVEDPMGENLTGQKVSYKVDKFGNVSDVTPVGYIEGWAQMQKIVETIVKTWYTYLPNETHTKGESWTNTEKVGEEGDLMSQTTSNYEFKEVKKEKGRPCAKVETTSESTVHGQQQTQIGTVNVDGTGKGSAEFYFCTASSTIVKYKAKVETKMDMTPEGGGDSRKLAVNVTMEREVL